MKIDEMDIPKLTAEVERYERLAREAYYCTGMPPEYYLLRAGEFRQKIRENAIKKSFIKKEQSKFDNGTLKRCIEAAKFEINVQLNSWPGEKNTPYVEGYINLSRLVRAILNQAAK